MLEWSPQVQEFVRAHRVAGWGRLTGPDAHCVAVCYIVAERRGVLPYRCEAQTGACPTAQAVEEYSGESTCRLVIDDYSDDWTQLATSFCMEAEILTGGSSFERAVATPA